MTIDQLAVHAGTTSRTIRSFQTMGLLDRPSLRGRTGLYGAVHLAQLQAILGLQAAGFSLQSLVVLFAAHARGDSLGAVLGLGDPIRLDTPDAQSDTAELYGFGDLQATRRPPTRGRALLSVVPTTVWDQTEAS